MRALVYEAPWQMPLRDIPRPEPGPDDVIVRVKAVGVCGSDVHGYTGATGRRIPPMVMGHEFCGEIESLGAAVAAHAVGDRVVVQPLITCGACENCQAGRPNICANRSGLGMMAVSGAYAEAVRAPQKLLHRLPDEVSWEQAALVEPLAVALHAANLTPIRLMDPVVILGAGTIGLLTIVVCRLKGAGTIIVSDPNPRRLALAAQLGADRTVDPNKDDVAEAVRAAVGAGSPRPGTNTGAPVVIEAVGLAATARQSLSLVRPGGDVTWIGNNQPQVEINMQEVVTREITVRGVYGFNREFGDAIEALRTGMVQVAPLIERVAPLNEGPALIDALARGTLDAIKVVLTP